MIKLIFASGINGEFGTATGMPWPRNKQDMTEFKKQTVNQLVLMGSETWKTLGSKPLPNRENLVLTNSLDFFGLDFKDDSHCKARVKPEAFGAFLKYIDNSIDEDVLVIGGANILVSALPYADVVFHSVIQEVTEEATVKLPYEGFFQYLYDTELFAKVQSKPSEDKSVVFDTYVPQVRGHF